VRAVHASVHAVSGAFRRPGVLVLCPVLGMVLAAGCPPPTQNALPVASAGADQSAVVGQSVTLDAAGSTDADGDTLSYQWTQTAGPAATLSSTTEPQAHATLPAIGVYDFKVTVADGRGGSDSDTARVTALASNGGGGSGDVRITGAWSGASGPVTVDLGWRLPAGQWAPVNGAGAGLAGEESITRAGADVADGFHWLTFDFTDQSADVSYVANTTYAVDFLGYTFNASERLRTDQYRAIGLAVSGGAPHVLYNGWVPADGSAGDPGSPTGDYAVEILAGWRAATGDVDVDISVVFPDGGTTPATVKHGAARYGFEWLAIADAASVPDGVYDLQFTLRDQSDVYNYFADVTYQVRFLDYSFDSFPATVRLSSPRDRVIRLRVTGGQAQEIGRTWN